MGQVTAGFVGGYPPAIGNPYRVAAGVAAAESSSGYHLGMGRTPAGQAYPEVLEAVRGGDTDTVLGWLHTLDDTTTIDARRWYRAVGRKTARLAVHRR
ncbi:hypothetical protein [Gordonia sp. NPDC003950]